MEQFFQNALSFLLLLQPIFQAGFFDSTEIIGRRDPLPDFSSQKDRTTRNITAFGARLKSVFLDATIPNAAPRMLFAPLAPDASTGRCGLILAAEPAIKTAAPDEIPLFVADGDLPLSCVGQMMIMAPIGAFNRHRKA
jgi:hypothetical protein